MKKALILTLIGALAVMSLLLILKRPKMFILIPDPYIITKDYKPDVEQMTAYYTELFKGKRREEIFQLFKSHGVEYIHDEYGTIFSFKRTMYKMPFIPFDISVSLSYDKDDVFSEVTSITYGGRFL